MAKRIQIKFHTKFYSKLKYQTVVLLSSVKMESELSGTGSNNQTEHYLFSHQSFLTRFMRNQSVMYTERDIYCFKIDVIIFQVHVREIAI